MYEVSSVNTAPFGLFLTRRANVWYTACDGEWSNPNTWISNGLDRKVITVPQPGDTIYINHTITLDSNIIVNNMYISGKLQGTSLNAYSITVNGDLQISGIGYLDLSLQFNNLILNGYNNFVSYANFNAGGYSTVTYNGSLDQFLLDLPYHGLTTQNGKKYQISDITVNGNFNQQSNYEVGPYNLTVNGTSTLGTVGSYIFSKNSSTGSILFVGNADFEGTTDLSIGNPNVEFKGGFTIHTFTFKSGSGTFTFSTNNQTLNFAAYLGGSWSANITISGAITVTWSGNPTIPINGVINGTVISSTLNNTGTIYLGNSTLPMATGVFNYEYSATSTLGYEFNGNFTLPYSSYANLFIGGTSGTKSLGANTTVNQSLVIGNSSGSGALLDCAGYDLDVKGAFTCYQSLRASSFCNITFEGLATFSVATGSDITDLRGGNPDIEFQNGIFIHTNGIYTGTGTFKFTTNNQTIDFSILNGGALSCNWLVSGAIAVKFLDGSVTMAPFTGTINGDNASSIWDCRGILNYQNVTAPMITGLLYCNQAANTFVYDLSSAQNIQTPSDPSSPGYYNLTLAGSGSKTLLGNTSVKHIYTLTSPATLNSSGYTLTNP